MMVYLTSMVYTDPELLNDTDVEDLLAVGAVFASPEAAIAALEADHRAEWLEDRDEAEEPVPALEWVVTREMWAPTGYEVRYWEASCEESGTILRVSERPIQGGPR